MLDSGGARAPADLYWNSPFGSVRWRGAEGDLLSRRYSGRMCGEVPQSGDATLRQVNLGPVCRTVPVPCVRARAGVASALPGVRKVRRFDQAHAAGPGAGTSDRAPAGLKDPTGLEGVQVWAFSGLGRVSSWSSAARSAGGAGPCRSPAVAALPGTPPHPLGSGRGLTDRQLPASDRPDPPPDLRRSHPHRPVWPANGGGGTEPAAAGISGAGGRRNQRRSRHRQVRTAGIVAGVRVQPS